MELNPWNRWNPWNNWNLESDRQECGREENEDDGEMPDEVPG
jgi:hypothetical protein